MNEMNQILLLLIIQIIGITSILRVNIPSSLRVWMSFIVGLLITVQAVIFSIYIFDTVKAEFIFGFLGLIFIFSLLFNLKRFYLFKELYKDLALLNLFIFIILLFFNYFTYSPDSFHYHAIALSIFSNQMDSKFLTDFSWYLINGRIIFLDALLILGFIFDIELFSSIFQIITFVSFVLVYRLVLLSKGSEEYFSKYFCIFLFFLLSLNMIVVHSTYLHSNLMTGVFYSIGAILLFLFFDKKDGTSLKIFGIIFLAVSILIRKEMVVFTLIPIIFVMLYFNYKMKEVYWLLTVFCLVAFQWAAYYFFKVEYIDFRFSSHGSPLEYVMGFSLLIILPFVIYGIKKLIEKYGIRLEIFIIIASVILLAVTALYDFHELFYTIAKFFRYTLFKINDWGLFWVILFVCFYVLSSSKIKSIFLYFILTFMVLRVLLYTYFDGIVDASSGNRMMIHIFFIALFVIMYTLIPHSDKKRVSL